MTIHLTLERRHLQLSCSEQALAKAALSRTALKTQFQTLLLHKHCFYQPAGVEQLQELTLQRMVSKYSEQLLYRPLEELHYWFTYTSGFHLYPGYTPLFYSCTDKQSIVPNKSAVAGIGEGIAGFLAQRLYGCRKLARPTHDFPDLVLESEDKTYLVEAKATTQGLKEVKQVMEEELIRLVAYVSACGELDSRPVVGLLVGTALKQEHQYQCCMTEVSAWRPE
jgi:hypothetical protein